MNVREIKVCIKKEPVLYDELITAMLEHHEYDGCYVKQYSEYQENGYIVALFTMCEANRPGSNQKSHPERWSCDTLS